MSEVEELKAKLEKVELQLRFVQMYLDPKDTSFRYMIHNFLTLSGVQKDLLIKLMETLRELNEGAEFYKIDDVNGQAGEICKQALAKIKGG